MENVYWLESQNNLRGLFGQLSLSWPYTISFLPSELSILLHSFLHIIQVKSQMNLAWLV